MTEAQAILKMIEDVSPDDADTLDEIDARVWCWRGVQGFDENRFRFDLTFDRMRNDKGDGYYYCNGRNNRKLAPKYTRSRDALKSIRPEGWSYSVFHENLSPDNCIRVTRLEKDGVTFENCVATIATEELAELHAIIQAIEWERKNDETL